MTFAPQRQISFPPLSSAVKALLLINGGVFLINAVFAGALADWFGVSLSGVLEFFGLGAVRLITCQFVHSYLGIGHILMNMLVLYFFGTMVESEVGRRGIIKLYLISGAVGGVLQILLGLALGTADIITIGASGACYGIMLYAACMAPTSRVYFFGLFPVQLRWLVGILVFIGVYQTILAARHGSDSDGVAHGAHLGGALWGFLAFRYFRSGYLTADNRPFFGGFQRRLQNWRAERQVRSESEKRATLDALLDKIQREGMSSLSAAERRFLERASKDMKGR